ncbi:hypothetical protein [Micromonospora sp. L32]|uniref:hypothetical protein n=1 Tax=Micromonospora sp. L32 TaxID=3452214 RepID=UPI003F8A0AF2
MDIKMCERGDYQPAVGTGIRPLRWCREHYLEEHGDEFVRAEVVGDAPVTDVRTGDEVRRGGTVELDPQETRIEQLVYAGAIRVLPQEKTKPAASDAGDESADGDAAKPARKRG